MSYVGPPFEHDIFVSYSHGDIDAAGNSKLKQWSQAFVRELESELRVHPRFGRDIRIFLDQHHRPTQGIDPMAALTDQLCAEISRSALLTVLMSPHYIESKWCGDEREWWCSKQLQHGLPIDGRIAVARIWPTTEPWPPDLADRKGEPLVGFVFYDKARSELRPQPYEWPEPGPDSKGPFREALLDLVGWLGLKLDEIKVRLDEQRRLEEEVSRLAAIGGQVIYLHGRADQTKAWERVGDTLSSSGFVVLPAEPDPIEHDPLRLQEIRQHRVETLSGCDALLLLATDNGRALDADLVVVGRQDRHSARAVSSRLLPCALLDSVGPLIATPKRKLAARGLHVDWIDATREPWTPEVQQWLGKASAQAERAR